jgi:hypothetical protein
MSEVAVLIERGRAVKKGLISQRHHVDGKPVECDMHQYATIRPV